jgi:lysozyme
MNTSPAGRAMIESFEGFRAAAYLPTPDDVPTIGYGHTLGVKMGDVCPEQDADEFLEADLAAAEQAVTRKVTAAVTQHQFDALVSFVFNVGAGNFESSTLLKLLNAGDMEGAANQFLAWDKQAGKVLPGLLSRRSVERAWFLTEVAS